MNIIKPHHPPFPLTTEKQEKRDKIVLIESKKGQDVVSYNSFQKRKILLKQSQSPSDALSLTRPVVELKLTYPHWQIDVRSPYPEIFNNNPHLTTLNEKDPNVETFNIENNTINTNIHLIDILRKEIEKTLKIKIKNTENYPVIYLSEEEKTWPNQVEIEFDWKGPFWILNAGYKSNNELKRYHKYQEIVDLLNDFFKYKIKIVQIGNLEDIHVPLSGTLNLIGKTNLRQLIRLAYWAEGTIGPATFQYLLAAAFKKPAVVISGGQEGMQKNYYPHIKSLNTVGFLKCCQFDGCWLSGEKEKCKKILTINDDKIPACFDMIKPHMVVDAVKNYCEGDILKKKNDTV